MSHSVYWCALCQIHSFLAWYRVSITLFCVAPLSHFHSIGHLPKFSWCRGDREQAEKERQEGSQYKSGFETTHLILKAKLPQWQLKCSVCPVDSPKWYCLLQSLNIMSWACKYISMAYDHPPERNSKGSKKEPMPSYRFLFQRGL